MNVIYERLGELCKEKGTSYNAVCKKLGIPSSTIGNLKSREKAVLNADYALSLANYFDVSVGYLIGVENEKTVTSGDGEKSELELAVLNASEKEQSLILKLLAMPDEQKNAFLALMQSLPSSQPTQDEKEQT